MKQSSNNETTKQLEQAWKKFDKGDFAGAEKLFSAICEEEEENPEALHGLAGAYLRRKDFNNALETLDKLEELNAKDAKAIHLRGLTYGADDSLEEAIEDLEKATSLYDDPFEAYLDLGGAFLVQKDFVRAAQCFEKCINIDGKCNEAWTGKALVAWYNKELKAALEYLNIALKINPKHLLALLLKTEILLETGKKSDAEKEVKKILAIQPDIFKSSARDEDKDDDEDDDFDKDEDAYRSEDDEIEEFELDD
ncbi:MAG: tetratricopeptide repeat protein [Bacteroidales bacterium]